MEGRYVGEILGRSYQATAEQGRRQTEAAVRRLLSQRRLPEEGLDERQVEALLAELADMDSNNFPANVGVGEREGRVYSALVRRRARFLAHGVGRSGDLAEAQPKAAGSSLLARLADHLALDALHEAGYHAMRAALVVPAATGMAIALALRALARERPNARVVVWPRIDQKAAFKAIAFSGLTAAVVPMRLDGDELRTDVAAVEAAVRAHGGADGVLCILSTTSCFAPRASDDVAALAQLAAALGVGHVVNNAYGVAVGRYAAALCEACARGRVDAVVQSTDKNFMVPVGGALVCAPSKAAVRAVAAAYPGRASASPVLDLFVTLLQMGRRGWRALLDERKRLFPLMLDDLAAALAPLGGRVLHTPNNRISIAFTLAAADADSGDPAADAAAETEIGSRMFYRGVSGMRVVPRRVSKSVDGHEFAGFGAHCDSYPRTYATVACAIGMRAEEWAEFLPRLTDVLRTVQLERSRAVACESTC
jgi:O-phospho-L-seryl-tRNASec:L-selenocysteinyl-tRNA synthase